MDQAESRRIAAAAEGHSLELVPQFIIVENPPLESFAVEPVALGLTAYAGREVRQVVRPPDEVVHGRWQVLAALLIDIDETGEPVRTGKAPRIDGALVAGECQVLLTDRRLAMVFRLLMATGVFPQAGYPPGALLFANFYYDWMNQVAYETRDGGDAVWAVARLGAGFGRVAVMEVIREWVTRDGVSRGATLADIMTWLVEACGNYRAGVVPESQTSVVRAALAGQRERHGRMQVADLGSWTPGG